MSTASPTPTPATAAPLAFGFIASWCSNCCEAVWLRERVEPVGNYWLHLATGSPLCEPALAERMARVRAEIEQGVTDNQPGENAD